MDNCTCEYFACECEEPGTTCSTGCFFFGCIHLDAGTGITHCCTCVRMAANPETTDGKHSIRDYVVG
jgi:hypothetical protein